MTHDISTIHTQIDALLARGAAPVNIVVNIDRATGQELWGEVTALESGEMAQALGYAFGSENGTDPADVVAGMLDADEYRARFALTTIDRTATAPNGSTFEDFENFVAELLAEGRGAHAAFNLVDPEGMDADGISLDLVCLDNRGQEFHGYYSTATYDAEGAVMSAEFVLGDFWASSVQAAWDEVDNSNAGEN